MNNKTSNQDNKCLNNEQSSNKKISSLGQLIDSLTPFEATTLATIIGYVLSFDLNASQQNALGNWIELIGQILLTFAAQGSISPEKGEYNQLLSDIDNLKKEIANLKKD